MKFRKTPFGKHTIRTSDGGVRELKVGEIVDLDPKEAAKRPGYFEPVTDAAKTDGKKDGDGAKE